MERSFNMPNIETLIQDFVAAFETRDAEGLGRFLHEDVSFTNYGDDEVRGRNAVVQLWARVFANFETVRFETLNQASNGPLVLAEQIHHLGLAGREPAPIRNMAVYELQGGLITVWRDYTDSKHARRLLEESKPRAA
jgi:limonene-1,2-epoxide hydrolase